MAAGGVVGQWLADRGLSEFEDVEVAHDFDSVEVIKTIDREMLKEMGVNSIGKQAKFLKYIKDGPAQADPASSIDDTIQDADSGDDISVVFVGSDTPPASELGQGSAAWMGGKETSLEAPDLSPCRETIPLTREVSAPMHPSPATPCVAPSKPKPKSPQEQYTWHKVLGYGASCKVVLAQPKEGPERDKKFAIKRVSKFMAAQNEQLLGWLRNERDILQTLSHPNIIKLHSILQSDVELFYVLEYAEGGELLEYIEKVCRFPEDVISTITAEIVLGLEYLFTKGVVHRDLKPENILLDADMHVKIIDFGTAFKPKSSESVAVPGMPTQDERGQTFCGTHQYLSPEALAGASLTCVSDLWQLGCIVYQMATGTRPFEIRSSGLVGLWARINKPDELGYPTDFPTGARDLCQELFKVEPATRLGAPERGGLSALKKHRLFKDVDWDTLNTTPHNYRLKPVAPLFVKDADARECHECGKKFTFFRRRHHCRKCGRIFCGRCSENRVLLPDLAETDGNSKKRVCSSCLGKLASPGGG